MSQYSSQPLHTSAPEIAREFESQTRKLLVERFMWFTGLGSVIQFCLFILNIALAIADSPFLWYFSGKLGDSVSLRSAALSVVFSLLLSACYVASFLAVRRNLLSKDKMLLLSYGLLVADGMLRVILTFIPESENWGLFGFMLTHVLACAFLPWSAWQAAQPLIPVLGSYFLLKLFFGESESWIMRGMGGLIECLLVGTPGVLLALVRQSFRMGSFERTYLYKRYRDVRRELYDARRIHESLFPQPITKGPVQMRYKYEPMQLIGGDFLFANQHPSDGSLSVVLLDVTGHGISAALTVNRIAGELTRIFGEDADADPARVLHLLNRYAHITLAGHSIYMTALCLKVEPQTNLLRFASGGHPPAYIKRADGKVEELSATSFLLGACASDEYAPGGNILAFHTGDTLVAYTDGVIEAQAESGSMLGLTGIRRIMEEGSKEAEWPHSVMGDVEKHRFGPPEDDILVIEVRRTDEPIQPAQLSDIGTSRVIATESFESVSS